MSSVELEILKMTLQADMKGAITAFMDLQKQIERLDQSSNEYQGKLNLLQNFQRSFAAEIVTSKEALALMSAESKAAAQALAAIDREAKKASLNEVKQKAREAAQALKKLNDESKLSSKSLEDLGRGAAINRENVDRLHGGLRGMPDTLGKVGKGSRDSGRAMLELSRGFEDAQYGVHGVLNNLPTLIQTLGGPAGLAGIISILAVSANILYQNWDSVASLWGEGGTRDEADEMENLGKQTKRTADEEERYQKLKGRDEARKTLNAPVTKEQETRNKAVAEAIAKAGTGNVAKALKDVGDPSLDLDSNVVKAKAALKRARKITGAGGKNGPVEDMEGSNATEILSNDPKKVVAEAMRIAKGGLPRDLEQKRQIKILEAEKALEAALTKAAKERLVHSSTNPASMESLISLIERNPEMFPSGLADSLRDTDPEKVKKDKDLAEMRKDSRDVEDARIKKSKEETKKLESDLIAKKEKDEKEQVDIESNAIQEVERQTTAASKKAKDSIPELDEQVKGQIKVEMLAGKTGDAATAAVADRLKETLKGMGIGPATADRAADAIAKESAENLDQDIYKAINSPDKVKDETSKIFDAANFGDTIQQAFGKEEDKTQKDQLDKLRELVEIGRQNLNRDTGGFVFRR